MAVEYELDGPLDLKQKWNFLREKHFFVQHQCSTKRAKALTGKIKVILEKNAELLGLKAEPQQLQVRFFSGHGRYRTAFRFSQERQAHYDERLNLAATHCGIPEIILEEHLLLHQLSPLQLRPWQRVFLAEILPLLGKEGEARAFGDAGKTQPKPLRYLLLSNHRPERPERATMRRLTAFLVKNGRIRDFSLALIRQQGLDDTAMEILESMFALPIEQLETLITPAEKPAGSNNTLPRRK